MGVKWTEEQEKVIRLRNCNILVSAAAGSGKTAVLVERIIQRITDGTDPVDVDRLLIVTFTEAAAAEMKERIGAAIEKKLAERPGDARLEQQATLIHSASITTIHSFCLSVIRDHFHVIGIDPGFRVAEEGELKLLKQDVLEEMLEEYYGKEDPSFLEFVERFGTGRNDRKIEGLILELYEYSRSYPQPDRWLDDCVSAYRFEDAGTAGQPEMDPAARALHRAGRRAADMEEMLRSALKVCEEPDGPYMYGDMIESDLKEIRKISQAGSLEELYDRISTVSWKRLSAKKDETVSPEKKEQVKKIRDQVKKLVKDLQEAYFYAPPEVWRKDMEETAPMMEMLADLVKRFAAMLREKKAERNMIDFNDMEQFALAILTEEKDGRLVPSAVAREYQEQFEEVMIDEYQDSNLVQEAILTSVSRVETGQYNIFMVGDVKQSIYRFRLSRPELFMEKYHTYSLKGGDRQRIDLHRNFRSRPEVLEGANYIFRRIMRMEFGGIEYDDNAALWPGAAFPPLPQDAPEIREGIFDDRTELLLLDKSELAGEEERRAEARMIARRIRELTGCGFVIDKETGEYRRIRYRDIVILTRSIRGWAETFTSVLAEEGIPAYSVSREGYFETYEVSVLLDYLKILDNARQDLPLAAVLTSPIGGLDTKEMAQIRITYPNVPFYEAVSLYAGQNPGEREASAPILPELREKLERFCRQADQFRIRVPYTAIHDLLSEILEETGYGVSIAAMPGGVQRTANVEMLVEKASAFEGTSYKGLFNFVRYIEQLKKYDVDYGEASVLDEQSDTVRIMSIHKSKGLEFPVVFAAGMGKRFNTQDTKGSIVLHPELGVGMDDVDLKRRTKAPTFLKKVIQEEVSLENLAEELRILYVAMTRAKEKLILTGTGSLPETILDPPEETAGGMVCYDRDGSAVDNEIPLYVLEKAKTCLDWLLPAIYDLPSGRKKPDCPISVRIFTSEELTGGERAEEQAGEIALDVLRHWNTENIYDTALRSSLQEQMDYRYPYEDTGRLKRKFTVSELKKYSVLAEEAGEEMYQEPEAVPLVPRFMTEEEGLTGASRGSAYHKLLELLDFTLIYDEDSLKRTVDRFQEQGKLTREMAECIRPEDILKFLRCSAGQRMSAAAARGRLHKEQPFVMGVDASEIYPDENSREMILVQGIIDVYFEEDDGLVVLDYKTDKVRAAAELKEKYHAQLDYYAEALSRLLQKPVKEKIIYSFTLREEIPV